MKVQLEHLCTVGVIVDTEEGTVEQVIVWDESLGDMPVEARRVDSLSPEDPEYEARAAESPHALRKHGIVDLFDPLPLDHPEVTKAREIASDGDPNWPAWEFGG